MAIYRHLYLTTTITIGSEKKKCENTEVLKRFDAISWHTTNGLIQTNEKRNTQYTQHNTHMRKLFCMKPLLSISQKEEEEEKKIRNMLRL